MLSPRARGLVSASPVHPSRLAARSLRWPCLQKVQRQFSASANSATYDVAVLGGGLSGLATAYFLSKKHPTARITIYEATDKAGGWATSTRVPVAGGSVLFEGGPRTIRPNGNGILTARLMQELDLTKHAIFTQKTSPAALNRFVYYPDHLVCMPNPSRDLADNLWTILREPMFEGLIWSMLTETWRSPREAHVEDESIGHFVARRLNKNMVDRALSAVLHGIYAGDVWKLSVKSIFPSMWQLENAGSITQGLWRYRREEQGFTARDAYFGDKMKSFAWDPLLRQTLKQNSVFTFNQGIQTLIDRLCEVLFASGQVTFKMGTPVQSIATSQDNDKPGIAVTHDASQKPTLYSHVISALSPTHLNSLMPSKQTPLVPEMESVTVMTVNLYFRTPDLHEPGFGYLIPQATSFEHNPERALGVIFDNAYAPSPKDINPANWHMNLEQLTELHASGQILNMNDFSWYNFPSRPNIQDDLPTRGTKLTVMLGGHLWDGWTAYPDEQEGLAMARSLVERHLGIKEAPEAWRVNLQRHCIPQYHVGHERRLKTAHNRIWQQYRGRLRVVGNWMSGVGVNDCIRSGWEVAEHLSNEGTGLEQIGKPFEFRLRRDKDRKSS